MEASRNIPPSIQGVIILVGCIALIYVMIVAQSLLVPLVFAAIIAILFSPVVDFLVRLKLNRIVSILITLVVALSILIGLTMAIIHQISLLSDSWPILVKNTTVLLNQAIGEVALRINVNPAKIDQWLLETQTELISIQRAALGSTLLTVGNTLTLFFLLPVYVFLFLLYKTRLVDFIYQLTGKARNAQVKTVIGQSKQLIQQYLIGLLIEIVLVGVLNVAVLLILGIPYAILLGVVAALLNLIPYLGGIFGVGIPMAVAMATQSSAWYAVYVLIGLYIVQLIDNNYIVPKIVASKVKINALVSIVGVLVGNAIWGIPGMFLALPLLAIVKLTCDNIESLKPWGYLLGDGPIALHKKLYLSHNLNQQK